MRILGVNPYVLVSAARAEKLQPGWRKPMPVLVRINRMAKKAWRINMMPTWKEVFIYICTVRKASNTTVGDRVEVEVEFDTKYRSGPSNKIPPFFKKALAKNSKARKGYNALIPSRQKEIIRYLSSLKSKDAQDCNLAKVLNVLSGSEDRFMGRSWSNRKWFCTECCGKRYCFIWPSIHIFYFLKG